MTVNTRTNPLIQNMASEIPPQYLVIPQDAWSASDL